VSYGFVKICCDDHSHFMYKIGQQLEIFSSTAHFVITTLQTKYGSTEMGFTDRFVSGSLGYQITVLKEYH